MQRSNMKAPIVLGKVQQVPQQYAKPLRKTAYLLPYPHVINGGILYKEHEYPVLNVNDLPSDQLMNLFMRNEVSFSADRVKDARKFGWPGQSR